MDLFNKKGISLLEYLVLVVIIITAFLVMRGYIQRGINGNMTEAGKTFGFGRQYDGQKTIDCSFDDQSNIWYDSNCFHSLAEQQCGIGNSVCEEGIITSGACADSSCIQLNNGALL